MTGTITIASPTRQNVRSLGSGACRTRATGQGDRRRAARTGKPSGTMGKKAQTTLENLRLPIHGVTAPFSCEGTFVPDKPVIFVFKGKTRLEVTRATNPFEQKHGLQP